MFNAKDLLSISNARKVVEVEYHPDTIAHVAAEGWGVFEGTTKWLLAIVPNNDYPDGGPEMIIGYIVNDEGLSPEDEPYLEGLFNNPDEGTIDDLLDELVNTQGRDILE